MLPFEDQIVFFVGIFLQVVKLVQVPDAVVLDELVAVGAEGEDRRRVREIVFPVILVQDVFSPVGGFQITLGEF
jgi:hypothetical protein